MKSISRGLAILALTIVAAASGCTETDFLNPGTYRVTLVTDVDDSIGFECVLVDVLELKLKAVPEAPGDAVIRAFPQDLGSGGTGGVTRGVRNVNFSPATCPIGACSISNQTCAEDSACAETVGSCLGAPQIPCQRDTQCPDVGGGAGTCEGTCDPGTRFCVADAECTDPGDTCNLVTLTCGTTDNCSTNFDCDVTVAATCNPPDSCRRFNASNAAPTFVLPAGTYRIVNLVPATITLGDLDDATRFRSCGFTSEDPLFDGSKDIVGFAEEDVEDLTFTVGPTNPNQLILTLKNVAALEDPSQTPPNICFTNDRAAFWELRDPQDG